MKRPWAVATAIVLSAGLAAGCGATKAVKSARASLERAKAAGAETKAPYEYYAAEAYFHQANHEVGEGDTKQGKAFANQSEFFSAKAIEKAGGGAK
jgi:hypothetical protein